MRDSYSLVCFSSLWFEKDSRLSHFKVFKDLKLHSALVFVLNVFPQWLLGSFLLTVCNVFNSSHKQVSPRFSWVFRHVLLTFAASDFISNSCSSAYSNLSCVARETCWSFTMFPFICSRDGDAKDLSKLPSTSFLHTHGDLRTFQFLFTGSLQLFCK